MCKLCSKDTDAGTMLECDACLCGFHLHCLDPPLSAVPDVRLPTRPRAPRGLDSTAST